MGKHHLWRKHSYVRVEKPESGCVWALFRVLNYHRWYNVKKMLPYKKQKSHEKPSKNTGKGNPDDQYQFADVPELEDYDAIMLNSPVNTSSIKALSTLIEEEDNSSKLDLADQQRSQLRASKDDRADPLSTPTLLSLLKADPTLDSPRKRRLSRSGTYPSPNASYSLGFGRTPSKVETKHTEIWPVMNHEDELRKTKSLRMRRSSSLSEPFDKYGNLFETNNKKETKKFPSFSDKEFTSLGDHHLLRKSFSERLSLLEIESYTFPSSEAPRLSSLEMLNYSRGLRLDSPGDIDGPKHTENLAKSQSDEKRGSFVDEIGKSNHQEEQEQIDDITSENAEIPLQVEDSVLVSQSSAFENAENAQVSNDQFMGIEKEIEDYNEEFEYVKHILDVLGFAGGEDQYGTWESPDEALDPELFEEIEVLCPFKPKTSTKELAVMDRKILFHLIIEALVDIHEKLFSHYSPNSLSFSSHIRAMPKGRRRVVEEVWEFAGKYLHWRSEFDPRLDAAMAHDLSKTSTSWKNPQTEVEYVGLDLEELIFNELLDEILS